MRYAPRCYLISHRHISAIPHFAAYRTIIVQYAMKTSAKQFCDTIVTSIARYEKYRCWASWCVSCGFLEFRQFACKLPKRPISRESILCEDGAWLVVPYQPFPSLPSGPKLLQKNSLQNYFLEAINFVSIAKILCIQLEKARKDHRNITKIIVSGNYFVIISARMAFAQRFKCLGLAEFSHSCMFRFNKGLKKVTHFRTLPT